MKNLLELDHLRDVPNSIRIFGWLGDGNNGLFVVPSCEDRRPLSVIASAAGEGWDHVSVSRGDRIPTWREMEQVKRLFFLPTETVMQLHPPESEYISGRALGGRSLNVLHLWRPLAFDIPLPPPDLVGPK